MGVGILVSAGVLVADGVKRLLPGRAVRRHVAVLLAVRAIVTEAAAAAGVTADVRTVVSRRPRSPWCYAVLSVISAGTAGAALRWSLASFRGTGVFGGNGIVLVFGAVATLFLGALGIVCLVLAGARRRSLPILIPLVRGSVLGRWERPPETETERARLLLPGIVERSET